MSDTTTTTNESAELMEIRSLFAWLDTLKGWDVATHHAYMEVRDTALAAAERMEAHNAQRNETATRWAVIDADADVASAANWCPYEDRKEAELRRRWRDKNVPNAAPHRVIRVEMAMTVEAER